MNAIARRCHEVVFPARNSQRVHGNNRYDQWSQPRSAHLEAFEIARDADGVKCTPMREQCRISRCCRAAKSMSRTAAPVQRSDPRQSIGTSCWWFRYDESRAVVVVSARRGAARDSHFGEHSVLAYVPTVRRHSTELRRSRLRLFQFWSLDSPFKYDAPVSITIPAEDRSPARLWRGRSLLYRRLRCVLRSRWGSDAVEETPWSSPAERQFHVLRAGANLRGVVSPT